MNQVQELLDSLPPMSQNNSRQIVRDKILAYKMNPCDRTAKALRDLGIEPDHDDYFEHYDEIESHN